jgi:putative oxidoreductase
LNNILMLIGRVLIAVIFVPDGYGKLMNASGTIAYIAKANLPLPTAAFAFAVFMELFVGLAVLFGLFTRLSGFGLALWCILTAAVYHMDWSQPVQYIQFTKNLCMAGGLLYVASFGAGAYSLDAILGRRRVGVLKTA